MTAAQAVLDASALLAFLRGEPGADTVRAIRRDAAISVVNVAEALQVLMRVGFSSSEALAFVRESGVRIESFEEADAVRTRSARARRRDRGAGLSLGDRACLALALRLGVPAYTADRAWAGADVGCVVAVIR